ncbi:MAG TPA: hypothetical protein VF844_04820, partial [Ktedonobacteraceae bacterium]
QENTEKHSLRVSDVILRYNHSHKDVFSHLIRIATNSKWSHSALIYLLSEPDHYSGTCKSGGGGKPT